MNGDVIRLDGAGGGLLRRSAAVRETQRPGERERERGEKGNYGFITSAEGKRTDFDDSEAAADVNGGGGSGFSPTRSNRAAARN